MTEEPQATVLRIALEATRSLERAECLQRIAEGALSVCGGEYALGYLLAADREELDCVASAGGDEVGSLRRLLEVFDADLAIGLTRAGPELVADANTLVPSDEVALLPDLGQALLAPLRSSAGQVGLLLLVTRYGQRFDSGARRVLAQLGDELVAALDNLRWIQGLRELVIRDDTADCYNRRHLDQSLREELERARRYGGHFAIIFLDLDNLKQVNTAHGHATGSRVLREASIRIARSIRGVDRLFRFGGDEFVVLLPGTDLSGGREVAERVGRELSKTPVFSVGGAPVRVTASTGIAAWPEHGNEPRTLIEAADAAMQRVKGSGKDGVEVALGSGAGSARPADANGRGGAKDSA
ncbi:MAG: GGDEF domain-containing protein [Acidobacteriota bacterium]|nr:MAG: GGDEF domain-containing protein [Acidobacteriota bacterium]